MQIVCGQFFFLNCGSTETKKHSSEKKTKTATCICTVFWVMRTAGLDGRSSLDTTTSYGPTFMFSTLPSSFESIYCRKMLKELTRLAAKNKGQ